jgi:neutral ceramidase
MLQALPDGVGFDAVPRGSQFGDLVTDVANASTFEAGGVLPVAATWWGANPRANLRHGGTFLTVDYWLPQEPPPQLDSDNGAAGAAGRGSSGTWVAVATDADFCTRFRFLRPQPATRPHESHATVEWYVPADAAPGYYRLHYYGDATPQHGAAAGTTVVFEGTSSTFQVTASPLQK